MARQVGRSLRHRSPTPGCFLPKSKGPKDWLIIFGSEARKKRQNERQSNVCRIIPYGVGGALCQRAENEGRSTSDDQGNGIRLSMRDLFQSKIGRGVQIPYRLQVASAGYEGAGSRSLCAVPHRAMCRNSRRSVLPVRKTAGETGIQE